jgi:hypothetical protein
MEVVALFADAQGKTQQSLQVRNRNAEIDFFLAHRDPAFQLLIDVSVEVDMLILSVNVVEFVEVEAK